jgi:hypothetical protein
MNIASHGLFRFMGGVTVAAGIIAEAIGLRDVLAPNDDRPPPGEWLTEIEQEKLADLVSAGRASCSLSKGRAQSGGHRPRVGAPCVCQEVRDAVTRRP